MLLPWPQLMADFDWHRSDRHSILVMVLRIPIQASYRLGEYIKQYFISPDSEPQHTRNGPAYTYTIQASYRLGEYIKQYFISPDSEPQHTRNGPAYTYTSIL
uniref:Uncharacterized protein n=1 Tax=Cacopsylla melanoneura TaxID=428564 RepID=A0A8D8X8E2_9HEMI